LLCPGWHVGTQSNQSFPEKLKKMLTCDIRELIKLLKFFLVQEH
jgi:hypothetical protein